MEVVGAVENGFLADREVLVVLQDGGAQDFGREVFENVRTGQVRTRALRISVVFGQRTFLRVRDVIWR